MEVLRAPNGALSLAMGPCFLNLLEGETSPSPLSLRPWLQSCMLLSHWFFPVPYFKWKGDNFFWVQNRVYYYYFSFTTCFVIVYPHRTISLDLASPNTAPAAVQAFAYGLRRPCFQQRHISENESKLIPFFAPKILVWLLHTPLEFLLKCPGYTIHNNSSFIMSYKKKSYDVKIWRVCRKLNCSSKFYLLKFKRCAQISR